MQQYRYNRLKMCMDMNTHGGHTSVYTELKNSAQILEITFLTC